MELRKKIAWLRKERGIGPQAELARLVDVSPALVSQWENGTGKPTLEKAHRLARVLGVSLDYLADDEQAQPPGPALTDDEAYVLRTIRNLGVSGDFVVQAIRTRMKPLQVEQGEAVQVESDPDPDELRGPGGGNPGPVSVRRRRPV